MNKYMFIVSLLISTNLVGDYTPTLAQIKQQLKVKSLKIMIDQLQSPNLNKNEYPLSEEDLNLMKYESYNEYVESLIDFVTEETGSDEFRKRCERIKNGEED